MNSNRKLRDEELDHESYMPGSEISIPIILCVLAIVTSIAGAALFLNQVGQIRELQEKNW